LTDSGRLLEKEKGVRRKKVSKEKGVRKNFEIEDMSG
jgi:hypothetical protein